MKKFGIMVTTLGLLAALLAGCGTPAPEEAGTPEETTGAQEAENDPTVGEVSLDAGSVTVYDYGNIKLHAYLTGDSLADVAYIVEGEDGLVGIELPSFTENLEAWKGYVEELGKPMEGLFLCNHPAGASYAQGVKLYGTQGAKDAIESGSTYATTQGLYESFGADFHGGPDMAQIDTVVSGSVNLAGIDFKLMDQGESYDLEIPALNVIYTHMLGKTTHSILTSVAHMDAMAETLKGYQTAGYALILTSHGGPEAQDAVTEKLSYLEKTKAIAEESSAAEDFTAAMKEAFPNYGGENYLEMTAGYLYP